MEDRQCVSYTLRESVTVTVTGRVARENTFIDDGPGRPETKLAGEARQVGESQVNSSSGATHSREHPAPQLYALHSLARAIAI